MLFEDLAFSLAEGDMLQIVGPNGSGKTSLLRLIAGLMEPSSGELRLFGEPLARQRHELTRNLLWIGHAPGGQGPADRRGETWPGCAPCISRSSARPSGRLWPLLACAAMRMWPVIACQPASNAVWRWPACICRHRRCGYWMKPFTALDKQGVAQLEQHLARHCEQGGSVVFTTHHSLGHKPASYRELDLGQWAA